MAINNAAKKVKNPMKGTIRTKSGVYFNFINPQSNQVNIEDIAHALSMICRFTDHTNEFYSVAQHSVMVSDIVKEEDKFSGLIHDVTEAYIGDISTPLKHNLSEYILIEKNLEKFLLNHFGLSSELPKSVKQADLVALATEKRDLYDRDIEDADIYEWECLVGVEPLPETIIALSPKDAKALFLDRFHDLHARHLQQEDDIRMT